MNYLKNIVKILISLGLLTYLVLRADPEKILAVFGNVDAVNGLWFILAAFACAFLSVLLMSARWQALLSAYHYRVPLKRLGGFYLIGMFFNNFLPTSIGGDVIRVYKIVNETDDRTVGFAGVIIERILGIAATLLLAILALFFISQQFHSQRLLYTSIFLLLAIMLFFMLMVRNRPFKLLLHVFEKLTIFNIGEKFNKLFEAIHHFKDRRGTLLLVLFYSLLSQLSIILMNFFLVKAFALRLDISYLFVVIPVSFLLTILPSINGVGFRDLGFVQVLKHAGIGDAAALSLSFMNLLIPMIISVIGAVLFIIQKRQDKIGEINVLETSL